MDRLRFFEYSQAPPPTQPRPTLPPPTQPRPTLPPPTQPTQPSPPTTQSQAGYSKAGRQLGRPAKVPPALVHEPEVILRRSQRNRK